MYKNSSHRSRAIRNFSVDHQENSLSPDFHRYLGFPPTLADVAVSGKTVQYLKNQSINITECLICLSPAAYESTCKISWEMPIYCGNTGKWFMFSAAKLGHYHDRNLSVGLLQIIVSGLSKTVLHGFHSYRKYTNSLPLHVDMNYTHPTHPQIHLRPHPHPQKIIPIPMPLPLVQMSIRILWTRIAGNSGISNVMSDFFVVTEIVIEKSCQRILFCCWRYNKMPAAAAVLW